MQDQQPVTFEPTVAPASSLFVSVYNWMGGGLALTALIALFTASSPQLLRLVVGNQMVFFGLVLGELALVIALSAAIRRLSATAAAAMFLVYSALNGLTLSVIFLAYTQASIASTFFVTAGTFAAMSLYGATTKRDLSSFGSFLFMGLIGLIIASLANFFLKSEMIYWITTYVGVFIFVGLTAWDTQKIKALARGSYSDEDRRKVAILGALTLYLDFINLFLFLLRIFGRRR